MNSKDSFYRKYRRLLYILAAGTMIGLVDASSKIVIAICGVLLAGLFIAAFCGIRSRDFPASTKRISWLFLFCAAAAIFVTYAKLTGNWDPS
jgi:hypothetical protein